MGAADDLSRLRANVVGLGLIGGSVALALRAKGWRVTGQDSDPLRRERAEAEGIVDEIGVDAQALVSVVATPVDSVSEVVEELLETTAGIVTDTASVKHAVTSSVPSPRFIGGHPMAGSELDGLDGADPSMFERAAWVLTPTEATADGTFTQATALVRDLGAEVVVMAPETHDALVAVTSHVPHLVAASLMCLAEDRSTEALSLPRLAAGGFRDMTRVASGRPDIWRGICSGNSGAIDDALGALVGRLERLRDAVRAGRTDEVMEVLTGARHARRALVPASVVLEDMDEVRVPIPDRPGSAAEVFTIAADLGVNIVDFDITHSTEGAGGVVSVVVARVQSAGLRSGLLQRGFKASVHGAL